MKKTFEIKGMTCGHCEGRVTSEILTIPGVTEVIASAEKANVMVESEAEISQPLLPFFFFLAQELQQHLTAMLHRRCNRLANLKQLVVTQGTHIAIHLK